MNAWSSGPKMWAWLQILTFFGGLAGAGSTVWLRSEFVTRAELAALMKTSREEQAAALAGVRAEHQEINRKIDDITRLLIDRLPRP